MYFGINLPIKNEDTSNLSDNKNILVFDQKNEIIGIGYLEESIIIKPKVVFNGIG